MTEEDGFGAAACAEDSEIHSGAGDGGAAHGTGGVLDARPPGSSMSARLPLLLEARPPCLPPRRRSIAPGTRAQLTEWTRLALGLQVVRIHVEEWVATDSRLTPHLVQIAVEPQGVCVTIEKASERISISDVFGAFLTLSPRG